MCGIVGIVQSDSNRPVDREVLLAMRETLAHRGPDDEGLYVDGPVGLGHRRLSIIDLTTGRQPMGNETGRVVVVYNGEIYNWPELRGELEAAGHCFATRSDTEVIVHGYESFGLDVARRLSGMFAFALWDADRRRLVLARDRAGIKPLYYAGTPEAFLFGSELKALLRHPATERRIDRVALSQYLTFEHVPGPRTIFEGINKLPPGHLLTLENGTVTVTPYWDFHIEESERKEDQKSEAHYLAELKETLKEVVRRELVSDVPVGVLLSGGIDSTGVASLMCELYPGRVKSFSVRFDDPSFDETGYARLAALHLGTEHHEATLTSRDVLDLVPRLADFLDEPLGDSSIMPTFLLSRFTRKEVKVALGGDGGDELFGGYSTLQAHRLFDWYERCTPAVVREKIAPGLIERLPVSFDNISLDFKLRRFAAGQGFSPAMRHHVWLGSFAPADRCRLLQDPDPQVEAEADGILDRHLAACRARETLNRILYLDMKLYLEGDILAKVDRASMATSLEVRVPLLNPLLLDFSQRLPHALKLKGLATKHLLRKALADRVPAAILARGKKGFNMPVAKWLAGPLRPLAQDMLDPDRIKRAGWFKPEAVSRLLREHMDHKRDHRKLLWTLLVFELWRETWA